MASKAKTPSVGALSTEGFRDRVAVVTGAGSGMGRATALLLASRGLVVAVLDRSLETARATADEVVAAGGRAKAFRADVSKSKEINRAFARISMDLGPIGYLVNIAGYDGFSPLEKISDDEWTRMFAVAVDGCFHCCRAVLPGMMERGYGSIVNMSSLHAVRGQAGRTHYAASKAAIMGLTRSLAREKSPLGVRVNAVAPGPIDTPLWRKGRGGATLRKDIAERVKAIPLGRLGEAREVAELIAFLLSERASYITGQVVSVDGGEIMH